MEDFYSTECLSTGVQRLFNRYSRGPAAHVPYGVIHHAFEAVARSHPEVVAVRHHDGTMISYAELERRANILANELIQKHSLQRGDRVLLVYSRCIEMVIFILAVLKAGGQYIPLDGAVTPEETLSYNITNSAAKVVLCLPKFIRKVEHCVSATTATAALLALDESSPIWRTGNSCHKDCKLLLTCSRNEQVPIW